MNRYSADASEKLISYEEFEKLFDKKIKEYEMKTTDKVNIILLFRHTGRGVVVKKSLYTNRVGNSFYTINHFFA